MCHLAGRIAGPQLHPSADLIEENRRLPRQSNPGKAHYTPARAPAWLFPKGMENDRLGARSSRRGQ